MHWIQLQNQCCAQQLPLHDIMWWLCPHVVFPSYCLEAMKMSVRTETIRVNLTNSKRLYRGIAEHIRSKCMSFLDSKSSKQFLLVSVIESGRQCFSSLEFKYQLSSQYMLAEWSQLHFDKESILIEEK